MRAQVGCTAEGKLLALEVTMYSNGGNSLDLSASIMDRALLHIDCVYRIPNVRAVGHICRTNHASNTAFRGFGGPQVPGPYPVVTLTDNSLPSSNPAPHTAFYTVQLPYPSQERNPSNNTSSGARHCVWDCCPED